MDADALVEDLAECLCEGVAFFTDDGVDVLVDRCSRFDTGQEVKSGVAIDHGPVVCEVQNARRQRVGEGGEELFALAECFDCNHFLGDVDHVADDAGFVVL